jgi:hypothetical protein
LPNKNRHNYVWFEVLKEEKWRGNYLNLIGSEIKFQVEAKICGCNTKRKNISYHFAESDHNTYLEKTEIILAQIQACEILLKDTKDDTVASIIKSEIVDLTLVLAGTMNNKNDKLAYCTSYGCKNKAIIICSACFDFYSCGYEHAYLHNHPMDEFKVLA